MKKERLSGAQRFVLRYIENPVERFLVLRGRYAKSRYSLLDRGLISFNDKRGMYELTETGRSAMESVHA